MSEPRKLVIQVDLDASSATKQAESAGDKIWKAIKNDRGAIEATKAKVDELVASISASGGKMTVPLEQFQAASKTTGAVLDKLTKENETAIDSLCARLEKLKAKRAEAYANNQPIGDTQQSISSTEDALKARQRLTKKLKEQRDALDALNATVDAHTGKAKQTGQAEQSLTQKLAECKKRMQELASVGQSNSKEYQDQANKAKELSKALQQVNSDAKPDAHVRLRTAIMNAKQAMAEAKAKFGEGSVQYQQAQAEAVKLQQSYNALNKQIKNMSAPNATYQGIISGLSGISGMASAATGAMSLFGGESQATAKAMAKLQAIMSITMGLQSMSMALNQNSALQLNVIGKLTTWWATCKAKAAGATIAETTAITANTGAQVAETTAVEAGTVANVAHAASWKAVGIAIKSIPGIGWLITVITALISAVAAWSTHLKNLRKYQDAAAKAVASATTEYTKSQQQLDYLNNALKNAERGSRDWLEAKKALVDQYGKYSSKLSDEIDKVGYLKDGYDDLTKSVRKSILARKLEDYAKEEPDVDNDLKSIQEALNGKVYGTTDSKGRTRNLSQEERSNLMGRISSYMLGEDVEFTEQEKKILNRNSPSGFFKGMFNSIYTLATKKHDESKKYNKGRYDLGERFGFDKKEVDAVLYGDNGEKEPTHEEVRAQTKGDPLYYERLMKEDKERADDQTLTEEERKEAQKNYYEHKKMRDKTRFDPKDRTTALGNADIAEQKTEDTATKNARARQKTLLAIEQETEQMRINILEEGAEKRRRQRELDNKKELDSIQSKMDAEIEAEVNRQKEEFNATEEAKAKEASAHGKQYRKKAFDSGDILTADFKAGTDKNTGATNTGNVDASQINVILSKYNVIHDLALQAQQKTLEDEQKQQRLAMDEYLKEYGTYEEKKQAIAEIYADKIAKASTNAERMTLIQERDKALNDLDFNEFVSKDAAKAFGNIENLTQDTIAKLIVQLEKYRDKVTQTFDPDKIEKYNKALNDLKRAQAMGQGGVFSRLVIPDYFKQRKVAQQKMNDAEKAYNDLYDERIKKQEKVQYLTDEIRDKVEELTGEEIDDDQVTDGSTIPGIINALNAEGTESSTNAANELSGLNNQLVAEQANLNNVTTATDTAKNSFDEFSEAFKSNFTGESGALNEVSAIVNGINNIVQGVADTVNELADTADALGVDTSVGSGWDKAKTFMEAFSEASQGLTDAVESLKSGNIGGVISGITKSVTSWIKGFAAIHDASRERTIQKLQDQIEEYDRINKRIEHRLESQYSKAAASSYEEEIANLEKQQKLIQQQIDAEEDKKDTDDDRVQEWKDQIEELEWQIEEYKDAALDAILGEDISTSIDNFTDALVDAWGKAGERAQAAKDYVRTILRQMVQEAMKADLTEPIRKLREMMAAALDDDVVTAAEQEQLEQYAKQLAEETEQKYKWADNLMDDSSSQSGSSSGTFATASEESITELSGRAASIQTGGEVRRQLLADIGTQLSAMQATMAASRENDMEVRNLTFIAVGHLETIARNTNELYEMNERLDKIERNTRGL
jgi:hypothetical protein